MEELLKLFEGFGKIYAIKYHPLGDPYKFNETQLKYVQSCEVISGDYGPALCVTIKYAGQLFIPLAKESTRKIGDKPNPADVWFIKLIKEDEPNPETRIITRVL